MKRFHKISIVVLCTVTLSANADDLMQVYSQAVQSDPTFAQAKANWQSQKMNLPIAEAGYLPQVAVTSNGTRNYTHDVPSLGNPDYSWQYGYGLTLTQPIFNFAAWKKITGADASVKSATATYLAAQQSLMQRTSQAYFNVLQAYDQLRYTIANKRAVWEQYVTAREQFRVGLIAVTDEYEARARYDQVVAQQISSQNNLNIQIENLRAITGRDYASLKTLGEKLPLVMPRPNNMAQWVAVANVQNYSIKAQNFAVIAAMEAVKQQAAGGYPSLALQSGYSQAYTDYNTLNSRVDSANVGLALTYNPIQGGLVRASIKQAQYNYAAAAGQLDYIHRQTVDQTRTSFLSVLSFISQVQADKASIVSANNAVAATEAGFKVGTRTMVDVLNELSTLYQAQLQYANDQYSYINNIIALKAAAGTLSVPDLQEINTWLGKAITFPDQTSVSQIPLDNGNAIQKLKRSENAKSTNNATRKPSVSESALKQAQLLAPQDTVLPGPATT